MSMSTAEEEAKYPMEEAGGAHVPAHGNGTGEGARQSSAEGASAEREQADRELIAIGPTDI